MYFDQSTRSDSSDESLFLQKNVQITLKDISKQQKVSLEQSENHQYLTNSYEELTSAIEKEKLKSILVKGNTTSRRKPPPPPAGNQQTLPEFTRNRETKFTLNRANLKKSDPPKHHQYFEWIDDSPLTSPENIKFAR